MNSRFFSLSILFLLSVCYAYGQQQSVNVNLASAAIKELQTRPEYRSLDSLYKKRFNNNNRGFQNSAKVKALDSILKKMRSEASSLRIAEIDGVKRFCFDQSGKTRIFPHVDVARVEADTSYMHRRVRDVVKLIFDKVRLDHPEMIFPGIQSGEENSLYEQGINAASGLLYRNALQYFEKAFTNSERYPWLTMFNAGVANSKIPGRELRAIAWFGGFMTSEFVVNTSYFKSQIELLRERSHRTVISMLKKIQDVALRFSGYEREMFMGQVATLWMQIGDPQSAKRALNLIPNAAPDYTQSLLESYINNGDLLTAEKITDTIRDEKYRKLALIKLADAYLTNRDFTEAQRKITAVIGNDNSRENGRYGVLLLPDAVNCLLKISTSRQLSGDTAGLNSNWILAEKTIDRIGSRFLYCQSLINLAEAKYATGRTDNATADFRKVLTEAELVEDLNDKIIVFANIVSTLQRIGNGDQLNEALTKAHRYAMIADSFKNDYALANFAQSILNTGDIAGAKKIVNRIKYSVSGNEVLYKIILAFYGNGDGNMAYQLIDSIPYNEWRDKAKTGIGEFDHKPGTRFLDWISILYDNKYWNECPLGMDVFMDLNAHIKSINSFSPADYSYNVHDLFDKLKTIAIYYIKAEKKIDLMLRNLYETKG
jgi:tetratricopeptide (TPR) repeat protein